MRVGSPAVTWGFMWLMLALKIPLAALIYIVWWAIKQEPEQAPSSDDDGGVKRTRPHPPKPLPRPPPRTATAATVARAPTRRVRPRAAPAVDRMASRLLTRRRACGRSAPGRG